jgi:hypothetical protein
MRECVNAIMQECLNARMHKLKKEELINWETVMTNDK